METLNTLIENWQTLLGAIAGAITALFVLARVVVKITPSKRDDEALTKLEKVWRVLALKPRRK